LVIREPLSGSFGVAGLTDLTERGLLSRIVCGHGSEARLLCKQLLSLERDSLLLKE
jgi:hypothetical protein